MAEMTSNLGDGTLTISFSGHIDVDGAARLQEQALPLVRQTDCDEVAIDCRDITYLSSAGLRLLLNISKQCPQIHLIEVTPEVYEVFDMTGLTEILDIRKAYRRVSVEGCPVIGEGANGRVYRLSPETICKVYRHPNSLPEIHRERELARAAFVAGIPTAISFEVVRVGKSYGSIFELLDTDSLDDLLISGAWPVEKVAHVSAALLRQMAETEVDPAIMPSAREEALTWISDASPALKDTQRGRLLALVEDLPDQTTMVHGDFHVKNVMVQNGEPLLIDMDTLSHGAPIFDLAATYNAYVGRGINNPASVERFLGVPYETSCHLWDLIIREYCDGMSAHEQQRMEERIRLVSAVRLMSWPLRHGSFHTPEGRHTTQTYLRIIDELLPRVESLA